MTWEFSGYGGAQDWRKPLSFTQGGVLKEFRRGLGVIGRKSHIDPQLLTVLHVPQSRLPPTRVQRFQIAELIQRFISGMVQMVQMSLRHA